MSATQLSWDSNFFGKRIGRMHWPTEEATGTLSHQFDLLYVITEGANDIELPNFKETYSETYLQFTKPTQNLPKNTHQDIALYDAGMDQVKELYALALSSGAYSRFRKDPNFDDATFQSLYRTWVDNSISKAIADGIFIAKVADTIAGFVTFKNHENVCKIGLIAVSATAQGKGLGRKLMSAVEQQAQHNRMDEVEVTTQKSNQQATRFYKSSGYELEKTYLIKHFWKQ